MSIGYPAARRLQALYCLTWRRHMQYSSFVRPGVLVDVGANVRARRAALRWSQRELAERAELSTRFLAQLEKGQGNISLARFAAVADALGVEMADLLRPRPRTETQRHIALLGLRGAGKST